MKVEHQTGRRAVRYAYFYFIRSNFILNYSELREGKRTTIVWKFNSALNIIFFWREKRFTSCLKVFVDYIR